MAAHSRPSKIVSPNEAVFTSVQNTDPVGSFASEPFTLPKSPFNPRIRPFDEFYFTGPSNERYHPLYGHHFCGHIFFLDRYDNSLSVIIMVAVVSLFWVKSFRIRSYATKRA